MVKKYRRTVACSLVVGASTLWACSFQDFDGFTGGDRAVGVDPLVDGSFDSSIAIDGGKTEHVTPTGDGDPGDGLEPYVAAVLADDPAGYWRLEETTGTTAIDSSGKKNDALLVGSGGIAFQTNGARAKAYTLDGSAYLAIPDVVDVASPQGFTVEAWVRPTATDNAYRSVFRKIEISGSGPVRGVTTYYNASIDRLGFEGWTDSNLVQYAGVDLQFSSTEFTHVVVACDGSIARVYVNGILTKTSGASALVASTTGMRWGDEWIGGLDELALYAKPLSAERAAAHYHAAK